MRCFVICDDFESLIFPNTIHQKETGSTSIEKQHDIGRFPTSPEFYGFSNDSFVNCPFFGRDRQKVDCERGMKNTCIARTSTMSLPITIPTTHWGSSSACHTARLTPTITACKNKYMHTHLPLRAQTQQILYMKTKHTEGILETIARRKKLPKNVYTR